MKKEDLILKIKEKTEEKERIKRAKIEAREYYRPLHILLMECISKIYTHYNFRENIQIETDKFILDVDKLVPEYVEWKVPLTTLNESNIIEVLEIMNDIMFQQSGFEKLNINDLVRSYNETILLKEHYQKVIDKINALTREVAGLCRDRCLINIQDFVITESGNKKIQATIYTNDCALSAFKDGKDLYYKYNHFDLADFPKVDFPSFEERLNQEIFNLI